MLIPAGWFLTHLLRSLIIIVPLSMTAYYLISASHSHIIAPLDTTPSTLFHSASSASSKKDLFISQALAHDLKLKFDGTALTALCAEKQWNEGLIFKCDPAEGGISNVRNIFLNCLRYAIEAGATTWVLPTLIPLHTNAKSRPDPVPMSHFFETRYFTTNLERCCPQITILPDANSLWDKPSTSPPVNILPESLDTLLSYELHKDHQTPLLHNPSEWSRSFHVHLDKARPSGYSPSAPVLVNLKPPLLLQWPLKHDSTEFVTNFGLLLRFTQDLREMAAGVLYAIDQNHRLRIDPLGDSKRIQKGLFYGAHLRTAADAVAAGWTSYAVQSQNYLAAAAKAELSLIYVSSDNKEDTKYFAREARDKGIEVTNALQALSAASLGGEMEMERKRWLNMERSYRHCVDWIVLSRASVVGGTWESSFSWGLAMARHRSVDFVRWGERADVGIGGGDKGVGHESPKQSEDEQEVNEGDAQTGNGPQDDSDSQQEGSAETSSDDHEDGDDTAEDSAKDTNEPSSSEGDPSLPNSSPDDQPPADAKLRKRQRVPADVGPASTHKQNDGRKPVDRAASQDSARDNHKPSSDVESSPPKKPTLLDQAADSKSQIDYKAPKRPAGVSPPQKGPARIKAPAKGKESVGGEDDEDVDADVNSSKEGSAHGKPSNGDPPGRPSKPEPGLDGLEDDGADDKRPVKQVKQDDNADESDAGPSKHKDDTIKGKVPLGRPGKQLPAAAKAEADQDQDSEEIVKTVKKPVKQMKEDEDADEEATLKNKKLIKKPSVKADEDEADEVEKNAGDDGEGDGDGDGEGDVEGDYHTQMTDDETKVGNHDSHDREGSAKGKVPSSLVGTKAKEGSNAEKAKEKEIAMHKPAPDHPVKHRPPPKEAEEDAKNVVPPAAPVAPGKQTTVDEQLAVGKPERPADSKSKPVSNPDVNVNPRPKSKAPEKPAPKKADAKGEEKEEKEQPKKEGEGRVPVGAPNPTRPILQSGLFASAEDELELDDGRAGKLDGNGRGRQAWEDGLTTIFGPVRVGEMFWGAMWP